MTQADGSVAQKQERTPLRTVVMASSAGTAFEWYDFFVYGALTKLFADKFFNAAEIGEANATLAALAVFAAGLLFRPLGALVFGGLGDRFGRKGAFLATVLIMGAATFAIGLLPDNKELLGVSAVALVLLRILQGMAVGGEYGGAAIYVAEHCEPHHRGSSTGWIQASAAFGLVGALGMVLGVRTWLGEEQFFAWGWRIPFLASVFLVGISVWMRLRLNESPAFLRMQAEGAGSKAPFKEVFLEWRNLRLVIVSILSFLMAQGAIWWCAFSYSQIFLERFMDVPSVWTNLFLLAATVVSIPLYVFFGALSDRVGRKPVLIAGMALAVIAMFPAFRAISEGSNRPLITAQSATPAEIHTVADTCSFQFDLLGSRKYETACDIARAYLTESGIGYTIHATDPSEGTSVRFVGTDVEVALSDGIGLSGEDLKSHKIELETAIAAGLKNANYPPAVKAPSNPEEFTKQASSFDWLLIVMGFLILVVAATALYGPMAATLVELFPTRIRYTALSVPYHVGIGWVGGFMPMTAYAIATASGDVFAGLWYPVVFGVIGIICCILLYPETRGRSLD